MKLTSETATATQPFTVIEDPRITKDGVSTAQLREQFESSLKVRELVSDVNKAVARVRQAQAKLRNTSGPMQTVWPN